MAQRIDNNFSSYELTEAEAVDGFTLQQANLYMLQNELSLAAEAKLGIVVDPNNTIQFIQQEAFLRGKIEFINWLIAMHNQSVKDNYELAKLVADDETLPTGSPTSVFGSV